MKRSILLLTACCLGSCATTSAVDIRNKRAPEIFSSTKAPDLIAQCLADTVEANATPVVTATDEQTIVSFMIEGNAMLVFDITPVEGGSRIEARKAASLVPGMKQARACF